MGDDYPVGIWGNAYDAFNWDEGPPAHKDYIGALAKYTKEEHAVVLADHRLYRHADPGRGHQEGRQHR